MGNISIDRGAASSNTATTVGDGCLPMIRPVNHPPKTLIDTRGPGAPVIQHGETGEPLPGEFLDEGGRVAQFPAVPRDF